MRPELKESQFRMSEFAYTLKKCGPILDQIWSNPNFGLKM